MANPGEVNVILRGQFLVVLRETAVEVLIPTMEEHIYRAGSFFGETLLKPRPLVNPYLLTGVATGTGKFYAANIVLKGYEYDAQAGPDALYARIVLPRPKAIKSFRPSTLALQAVMDPTGQFHGKKPMGIHVLRYDSSDLNSVKFQGHFATPKPHAITSGGPQFINLHLVAEPDHTPDAAHVTAGFDRTIALLPALRGKIVLMPQPDNKMALEVGDHAALGFTKHELLTGPEVQATLASIGLSLRVKGSPGGPLVSTAPLECDPVLVDMSEA